MEKSSDLTGWLTTQESANILGYVRSRIIQLVHEGKFPNSVKIGTNIMIPVSDVAALKEELDAKKAARKNKPQQVRFKFPERPEITL